MSDGPKIGTLDIETAPIIAYVWALWKQNIGLPQIIRDWSILSYTYKWLHKKKCVYNDVSQKENLEDDSDLLKELWDFLDEADIVVAQNGVAFDIKKIMARFIQAGMPPPSPFKVVDTMLEARKIARFTSNKLAWLSEVLTDTPKLSHSEFPGFTLWTECLKRNPKAWKVMRKYNPVDVIGTEGVYLKLRPYIVGHPNVAAYYEDETERCPKCGSVHLEKRGFSYTQTGMYQRFICLACKGWSRGRYTINTLAKRKALLSN
jgi:hypothetical protein